MAITRNTNLSNVADLIFYLDAVNSRSYPGSGSTWYDLSANRNHFTLFNTPTYTQNGTTGTYLTFNGTDQYARSANAINFNAYSAVTLEIGYRPEFIDYAYWSSLQNNISASGGGAGAGSGAAVGVDQVGYAGGSGGGSIRNATSTTGNIGQFTPIEGYGGGASGTPAGYAFGTDWGAGGGGGSGGPGGNSQLSVLTYASGRGGTGTLLNITGTPTYYGGGGGGGGSSYQTVSGGVGTVNTGGGGAGGTSANGGAGIANSGGGGGGGYSSFSGGAGGSGVVIAAYYSPTQVALGGAITTASGNKWIHTFTTNSRFTATNTTSIELLVVGGGGGGGSSSLIYHGGGGGGAGGLRYFNTLSITTAGYYSVTVGLGGSSGSGGNTGTSGQSSSFTPVITVPTITTTAQILYETTGTGGSTATGGITLLMNANGTGTVAKTYLSMWQGFGPRLFGFTPNTTTSFNSVAETFVNGVDSSGRQALINGTTAQFFTNTAVTVLTSATTDNINGVDILVIGGGGAGGHLGGGGAGGHRYFTNQSLVANTNYTVTIGAGGLASTSAVGNLGIDSVFNTITGGGGGGGAGESAMASTNAFASGGGGGGTVGVRSGAPGYVGGNSGGNGNDNGAGTAFAGGGGGGAGSVGISASGTTTAGGGGVGTANSITGSSVTRAAGGGGGAYQLGGTGTAGTGGSSIGGNGGRNGLNATGGTPNTGSGGGGNGYTDAGNLQGSSGAGGSGVVILKYSNSVTISNPGGGLTFTTDSSSVAGYNITTFTAGTGQISFTATSGVTGVLGAFANTWTYVASRAGTGNFFRGDIAYVRAWGKKLNALDVRSNVSAIVARQPTSYAGSTILSSDPSVIAPPLYPFTTFTFTSAGLCGRFGPTFASLQADATYAAQTWTSNAAFFSQGRAQGYQVWQPPTNGIYEIEVAGGRGNWGSTSDSHGRGAIVRGNFILSTANKLEMVVGQIAGSSVNISSSPSTNSGVTMAGGGGGSFVVLQGTSTPIIIAGGGAGSYSSITTQAIVNGQTREQPRWDGYSYSPLVLGTNPALGGGGSGYHGGGGGGLLTAGQPYSGNVGSAVSATDSNGGQISTHGASFIGGSVDNAAGTWYAIGGFMNLSGYNASGGFGGGGGGHLGNNSGGGGGGYSGGHGGQTSLGGSYLAGIGGGSYIDSSATAVATSDGVYNTSGTFNGSSVTNIGSFNNSNGYIKITFLG